MSRNGVMTMPEVPPEAVTDAYAEFQKLYPQRTAAWEDLAGWERERWQRIIEAAAKRIYDHLGHDHYVIFTEDGWTTEHSVECRLSGHMHECAVHSAIAEWAADDPRLQGRWRIVSADGPVPVLERAEIGDPQ